MFYNNKCQSIVFTSSFIILSVCLINTNLIFAAGTFTVNDIAQGMLSTEKSFKDLYIEYETTWVGWNRPDEPYRVLDGIYAEKKHSSNEISHPQRYLDRYVYVIDPKTELVKTEESTQISFNGEVTSVLYRKTEQEDAMKGYLFKNYDPNMFSTYYMDPHHKIWFYTDETSLADIIIKNKNSFHVESEPDLLDGTSTVKLVGTFSDGNLTMRLWISPDHNFLPIKRQILQTEGRMLSETALYDLIELSNGMWYPRKIMSPADPPGAPNPAYVMTYTLSNIEVGQISEEFFSPAFPPNTQVYDDILKMSYTKY